MQLRWRMDAVDETERGKQRAASDGAPWPWRAKERGEEGRILYKNTHFGLMVKKGGHAERSEASRVL